LPKIKHTAALFTRTITTRRDLCNGLSEKKGRAACDLVSVYSFCHADDRGIQKLHQ
jgi:hypothetical protein